MKTQVSLKDIKEMVSTSFTSWTVHTIQKLVLLTIII